MFASRRPTSYKWIKVPAARGLLSTRSIPEIETAVHGIETVHPLSDSIDLSGLLLPAPTRPLSFAEALASVGVPATNKSPEDELLDLLQNAAEIEHGLMLQYLYTVYSLKISMISGILRLIAIEEMGHFISVQNLLIACGAEPHFGNGEWTDQTVFQPFPFKLEPASAGSLAKYTIAEMPDPTNVPENVKPDLPTIIAEADTSAKSPVETHRVGLLYAKIYWLLRSNDEPLADPKKEPWVGFPVAEMAAKPELKGKHVSDAFIADVKDRNGLPEQWIGNYKSVIVIPISDRGSALQSIARISGQGEGFGDTPQGHFERFLEAWRLAKKSEDLAVKAPTNPFYKDGPPPLGTGDKIMSAAGRQFARLGDGLYELVLLCIAANLLLASGTASDVRAKPAKAAIVAMRDCLSTVANALKTIPLDEANGESRVCGLPFSAVPEVESKVKAVLDRASTVTADLGTILEEITQGDASDTLKGIAQDIGSTIKEEITPKLDSLPR